jgi:hypothetical protein
MAGEITRPPQGVPPIRRQGLQNVIVCALISWVDQSWILLRWDSALQGVTYGPTAGVRRSAGLVQVACLPEPMRPSLA